MKIYCTKEHLSLGVQTIQSALSSRTTLPILLNFLMETEGRQIRFIGTDLEMGIQHHIPAEVESDGAITIPARKFFDILHSLPDGQDVELSVDAGSRVSVKCGRSHFGIIGAPKSEYPVLPEVGMQNSFELPVDLLQEMVEKTVFSASTDDTRHVLNGVFWSVKKGVFEMVATDGRRLSVISKKALPIDRDFQVIVPTKVLAELQKVLGGKGAGKEAAAVKVCVTENQILFQLKTTTIISRLVGGAFPNYQQVIPQKREVIITMTTADLLAVTKRAALCAGERGGSVKYTLRPGVLAVTASSQNLDFSDELHLEYQGAEFTIAFNPQFVLDVLKHMDSEKTTIAMTNPVNPALFEPAGGGDYRFVVMPMRA